MFVALGRPIFGLNFVKPKLEREGDGYREKKIGLEKNREERLSDPLEYKGRKSGDGTGYKKQGPRERDETGGGI